MGYLARDHCFGDQYAAAQAACGAYPIATATGTISCSAIAADGTSLVLQQVDATTGATTSTTVALSFASCDAMEHYTDAGLLFASGLAALAVVWCAKTFVLRLVANQ